MDPRARKQLISPALLLILLPPLFWAGNFITGRAVHSIVPPMTLSLWRWVIALVCVLPFAWKPMCRDYRLYLTHKWLIVRLSLSGVVAFNSLVYVGLHQTSASNALLLNSFIPVLIALFGAAFFKEKLRGVQTFGLVLSFVGVLIIVAHGDWRMLIAFSFSRGDIIVFMAMVAFAFYTLWLRSVPQNMDRVGLMGAQIATAFIFLIPLWFAEQSTGQFAQWTPISVMALAYLGVFPSVLAYLMYNLGVAKFGAARAGLCIHLIPVFGVVLAVIFLNESLHAYHAAGLIAILIGIRLAMKNRVIPATSQQQE
ncbi:TPA: DMT family transporter [Enterobacter cloacae]